MAEIPPLAVPAAEVYTRAGRAVSAVWMDLEHEFVSALLSDEGEQWLADQRWRREQEKIDDLGAYQRRLVRESVVWLCGRRARGLARSPGEDAIVFAGGASDVLPYGWLHELTENIEAPGGDEESDRLLGAARSCILASYDNTAGALVESELLEPILRVAEWLLRGEPCTWDRIRREVIACQP
ncbi:MAG: hypothetical protein ACKO5K_11520 [Armatimonadota bacterium]